jgi:hypothetical protein
MKQNAEVKEDAQDLFKEALTYAEELDDSKYSLNCMASLGILQGEKKFDDFLNQVKMGKVACLQLPENEESRRGNRVIREEIGFQEE